MSDKCPYCGETTPHFIPGGFCARNLKEKLEKANAELDRTHDQLDELGRTQRRQAVELACAREMFQNAIELCRLAERYFNQENYDGPTLEQFARAVRRWAEEHRALLDREEEEIES